MSENIIQHAIVATARKAGWNVTTFSTDRRERQQRRSIPDLYMTHDGQQRQVWIEVKDTGKKARPDQQAWIDKVVASGGEAYCCDSLDSAWLVLQNGVDDE